MPNVFTPNGGSLNPVFVPLRLENVRSFNLKVINRWGHEVFKINDAKKGWDGSSFPEGLYYGLVQYEDQNCVGGSKKGWVQLLRMMAN